MGKRLYRKSNVSRERTDELGIDGLLALKESTDDCFCTVHARYFEYDKLPCPACGSQKTRTSKVVRRSFKDILWGEESTNENGFTHRKFRVIDIVFHQRYLRCDGCSDIVFPEPIDFGDKGCRYTNRLSDALADGTFRFSYKKVCAYYGIPASTASIGPIMRRRIQHLESQLKPISTPKRLGIMQITYYRELYTVIFALLDDGIYCMDILPDTFEGTILEFLRRLDSTRVETVYMDPLEDIRNAAAVAFPGAEFVVTDECILRYAKNAMLEIIHEDGKRFPVKFKDNALTIQNRLLQSDYERKRIKDGLSSRPRLKLAYDKHQSLMDSLQEEWNYESVSEWIHSLPDELPEFLNLSDAVDLFESEIRCFKEKEKLPDFYPTAIQAICDAFHGMPHCIFDVLRARCFLTISHDTIEMDGEKYRLGIHTSRLTQNMNNISENIRRAREYEL